MRVLKFAIALAVSGTVLALVAAALDRFVPGRSTTYEGYNQQRVNDFRQPGDELAFRYVRNCEKPGMDAIVDQVWEKKDAFGRAHTLAYYTRMSNPLDGMSRESGIPGWRGLLTPPVLPPASDTPPGEFSVCNFVNTNERDVLYPSALQRADAATVQPTTADSIAWEARAATADQARALATLWEQARAELRRKGPAWKESVQKRVSPAGQESLETASVRYRGTDGSEVTLEYRSIEGNPSILAVLIAHKRLPKQAPGEGEALVDGQAAPQPSDHP